MHTINSVTVIVITYKNTLIYVKLEFHTALRVTLFLKLH